MIIYCVCEVNRKGQSHETWALTRQGESRATAPALYKGNTQGKHRNYILHSSNKSLRQFVIQLDLMAWFCLQNPLLRVEHLLKIQAFSGMTPCRWPSSARRFEGRQCLHLERQRLKTKTKRSLVTHTTTRRQIPEYLYLQQQHSEPHTTAPSTFWPHLDLLLDHDSSSSFCPR